MYSKVALLDAIISETPDVAIIKALVAAIQSTAEAMASEGKVIAQLLTEACDQYQIDMRNTARKEIILILLDYLKSIEYPHYIQTVVSCHQRFHTLSGVYKDIALYGIAAELFLYRMYEDRLSVSHLVKIRDNLLGAMPESYAVIFDNQMCRGYEPAIKAFKMGDEGDFSIIGLITCHYYFQAMQKGRLKQLFGHAITNWVDFITVLSQSGIDARSDSVLFNQGEGTMGIARFLREKLGTQDVFLEVMKSPAADLIMSQETRHVYLNGVFNSEEYIKRAETLLNDSTWKSVTSSSDGNSMMAQFEKDKKFVKACLESGAIELPQLTLKFLGIATRMMRGSVSKSQVQERSLGYQEISPGYGYYNSYHAVYTTRDYYQLTFAQSAEFPAVGEGLLAKMGEGEKQEIAGRVMGTISVLMADFARCLTSEQANRLVNELASGQHESRLAYATVEIFKEVNAPTFYTSHYFNAAEMMNSVYRFCVVLLEKCQIIPSAFIDLLPLRIKIQFNFNDCKAILTKADIGVAALANELKLVFPGGMRSLDEFEQYVCFLCAAKLSLTDILQAVEKVVVNNCIRQSEIDFGVILDAIVMHVNLPLYEVCQALSDPLKDTMPVSVFLRILRRALNTFTPETCENQISPLLTPKQRNELHRVMMAGLNEVPVITPFLENKKVWFDISDLTKSGQSSSRSRLDRSKLCPFEDMLSILPNFRYWRALGVDLSGCYEDKTLLDGRKIYTNDNHRYLYAEFKFYFMNASLQAYYCNYNKPLSEAAMWRIIMTALTGLSETFFRTADDKELGLKSFEESLVFWMTQQHMNGAFLDGKTGEDYVDYDRSHVFVCTPEWWKGRSYFHDHIKKLKLKDENELNKQAMQTTSVYGYFAEVRWLSDETVRLASYWMFETGAVSASSRGLIAPIQAAFLTLLKRHESLRVALRERMALDRDCLLLNILMANDKDPTLSRNTKAYMEAQLLLRDTPLPNTCVDALQIKIDAKQCTVRDVVLYLGLKKALTEEQFSAIVKEFLDKPIDETQDAEHAQIQDALLFLSEEDAAMLKSRLSVSVLKFNDVLKEKIYTLFSEPASKANKNLIWHIIHAGRTTAAIKNTTNAKHVKECLDHPEYSNYKVYTLFNLTPPAGAALDKMRENGATGSRVGGVVDDITIADARKKHEEAEQRNFDL